MAWVTVCKRLALALPKHRSFKPLDFLSVSSCSVTEEIAGPRSWSILSWRSPHPTPSKPDVATQSLRGAAKGSCISRFIIYCLDKVTGLDRGLKIIKCWPFVLKATGIFLKHTPLTSDWTSWLIFCLKIYMKPSQRGLLSQYLLQPSQLDCAASRETTQTRSARKKTDESGPLTPDPASQLKVLCVGSRPAPPKSLSPLPCRLQPFLWFPGT